MPQTTNGDLRRESTSIAEIDPRLYMAAERTFLAWIRTGVALMAFGFVVARFGVFLRQVALTGPARLPAGGSGVSLWIGTGFIAAGVVTMLVSAIRHQRYVRAIDEGTFRSAFGSTFALALAAMLGLAGVGMALFLFGL